MSTVSLKLKKQARIEVEIIEYTIIVVYKLLQNTELAIEEFTSSALNLRRLSRIPNDAAALTKEISVIRSAYLP